MKTSWMVLAVVLGVLGGSAVHAAERVSLFDGKTLDGWTIRTCEAKVDQGELLLVDGNGLVQTAKMYGDFVLEFDVLALAEDDWDSGVYFRYETVPEGRPWPPRYQANLLKGQEGNVGGVQGATSTGLYKPGEWNRLKLTVQGSKVSLEMNGKPAWKADGLQGPAKGYIGIQAEVPKGGQYRFKNIFLTEL